MSGRDKEAQPRSAARIKVFQPAEMACGGAAPARVHLLNLSTSGALLYGETVPAVGEEVRLACGIPLGAARVQWANARRFGVAFVNPIGSDTIEALVRTQSELIEATTQRLTQFVRRKASKG